MRSKIILPCILLGYLSCNNNAAGNNNEKTALYSVKKEENPFPFIASIPLPAGFHTISTDSGSFGEWLLHIPLKKDKVVYLFDGRRKENQSAQFAVLDISTGDKDLQQCADAVMRLRAEYLYVTGKFKQIRFTDNAGTIYEFTPPYTRQHLNAYLEKVFGSCGSASLDKQLKTISVKDIRPGDVLIRGGFPGHAEIIMAVAVNKAGKNIFLLAQSYMPAQDIHVLLNPTDTNLSPWYYSNGNNDIITPKYNFKSSELKSW